MQITTVSYQKTFNIGSYQSERIGVELSVEQGEDATLALDTARNLVHEYHQNNNPIPIYEDANLPERQVDKEVQPNQKLSKEEQQKLAISSCQDIKTLESYRLIVRKYDYLQPTYDETMERLGVT